jgi:hypothetical protein
MNPQIVQGSLALGALTNVALASTTCVKAYGSAVKLGNTLVVFAAIGASATTVTVTDSLNLQWQTAALAGVSVAQYAFFAIVTTAGTPTVTITTASTDIAMALYEIEGAGYIDTATTNQSNGTGSAPTLTCNVSQENELGFFCIAAEAGTISAASPASPASIIFDTGNIVVAGSSNLKNFGVFSAQFGAPINTTSVSGNQTNTFKAALSGSVVYSNLCFAFRPAAVQVNAQVYGGLLALTDSLSNTVNQMIGTGSATAISQQTLPMLYNGTTWDRQRDNYNTTTGDVTTLTSAAGTYNGATQTNYNARGAVITMLCGTVAGTPTVVMQLQWSPDAGTTWLNYGAATSAISVATGNTVTVEVYPTVLTGMTFGATGSVLISAPLPRTWRIVYTGGGTTYSIATTGVYVNYIL